ncbi:hypothetical protein J7413_05050 [Shimia sp. R10_1]|uniref:hypothetical protein n=1 Tax=Shimia sp. R10_1 TaxID=2821095 RepID=UPI001AD9D369|nr:hypothetical protein [Shimia sp. R10_1]MBO9472899.1 hypothetical protein [Shimia sp. R10_1]
MRITLISSALVSLGLGFSSPALAADSWDLDADGTITWAEMEDMRKRTFETFDTNQDGKLDNAEYSAFDDARAQNAKDHPSSLSNRAVLGLGRGTMDINLDGDVTRDEMTTRLREWFTSMDKDGDNILTKGEY